MSKREQNFASPTSFLHSFSSISSSISLLQCNFPSIRPGRISLSFLVSRALAVVSPSLAVTAPIHRKSIPRPMFSFVFLFVPFKESFHQGTRMTKTEHPQEEILSLSIYLSIYLLSFFLSEEKNDLSTIEFRLNSF